MSSWQRDWRQRLQLEPQPAAARAATQRAVKPGFIPRNHRVQAALDAAETGDHAPFRALLQVLQHPFEARPQWRAYAQPPHPSERVLRTFCGT